MLGKVPPKWVFVQSNTFLEGEKFILENYDATPQGVIQSWAERDLQSFFAFFVTIWEDDLGCSLTNKYYSVLRSCISVLVHIYELYFLIFDNAEKMDVRRHM